MVDILEMAKPEIDKRKKIVQMVVKLRQLKAAGKSDHEINDTIHSLNLPLDFHLFLMKNYWELMDGTHKIFNRN